jgi:hypothetical protein
VAPVLQGKVSKQATNGSKTAYGFSVSIGSSTVQLQNSLGNRRACACSEAGFNSQNGVCAWGVYYRRAELCCICGQEDPMQSIFIKKCVLFTVGSVCRVKGFTTGSRNSQGRSKVADDALSGAEVAENRQKTSILRVSTHW